MFFRKCLRHQNCCRRDAGWRARHKTRHHAGYHHRRLHDVAFGEFRTEKRERIIHRMARGLSADFGKVRQFRAVLIHMAFPRAAEIFQRERRVRDE